MKTRTRGLVAAALLALAGCAAANTSLQVSVLDKEGKVEKSEVAGHILAKLYDQLK